MAQNVHWANKEQAARTRIINNIVSSTKVWKWLAGGSMIFMGFLLLAFEPNGWKAAATEGNGRRAREDGKDGFRRGTILFACPEVHGEPASGDEIVGRDMVKDAKTRKSDNGRIPWQYLANPQLTAVGISLSELGLAALSRYCRHATSFSGTYDRRQLGDVGLVAVLGWMDGDIEDKKDAGKVLDATNTGWGIAGSVSIVQELGRDWPSRRGKTCRKRGWYKTLPFCSCALPTLRTSPFYKPKLELGHSSANSPKKTIYETKTQTNGHPPSEPSSMGVRIDGQVINTSTGNSSGRLLDVRKQITLKDVFAFFVLLGRLIGFVLHRAV
ncbi:hypothetical protein IW262DRAFT_1290418 [Armillaria fumosa]|nr:hypothetical protein IW262DRAFT_1290418 [Armillaria fumosa]